MRELEGSACENSLKVVPLVLNGFDSPAQLDAWQRRGNFRRHRRIRPGRKWNCGGGV